MRRPVLLLFIFLVLAHAHGTRGDPDDLFDLAPANLVDALMPLDIDEYHRSRELQESTTYSALPTASPGAYGGPCSTCNNCLLATGEFATDHLSISNASALAASWITFCNSTANPTDYDTCKGVAAKINSSVNLGHRAAGLCVTLQLCDATLACNITVAGMIYNTLDLCTLEGVPEGTKLVGFDNNHLTSGTCFTREDCSKDTTDYECDLANSTTVSSCNVSTGIDTCRSLGRCKRTACKVCKDCLVAASELTGITRFDDRTTTVICNVTSKCQAFKTTFGINSSQCDTLVANITTTPNLAKRAGGICSNLGLCPAALASTCVPQVGLLKGSMDLCTVEGVVNGALPSGVYASVSNLRGSCTDGDLTNCGTPASDFSCDMTGNKSACTCLQGTDTCTRRGVCKINPCKLCTQCVQQMQPFLSLLAPTEGSQIADKFYSFCTVNMSRAAPVCAAAQAEIANSYNSRAGRRIGLLCTALGECSQSMAGNSTSCSIALPSTGLDDSALDLCTQQGIGSGTTSNDTVPAGSCKGDTCEGGKFCNLVATNTLCSCVSNKDTCEAYGQCQETPCTTCKSCISTVQDFVTNVSDASNATTVATGFKTFCNSAAQLSSADCAAVSSVIASNGNAGRRSGAICTMLGKCPATLLNSTCNITATLELSGGLDLCTREGVQTGNASLPNVHVGAGLPGEVCQTDADCASKHNSSNYECNRQISVNRICSCTSGLDTCIASSLLGQCTQKPPPLPTLSGCQSCQRCLSLAISFVADKQNITDSSNISSVFAKWCSAQNRTSSICSAVSKGIASSYHGNLGKRAGAICVRLGECNTELVSDTSCQLTLNTQKGALSECSVEGVAAGAAVPGIGVKPNNTCVDDSSCSVGHECKSDASTRVCSCRSGFDSCDSVSTCQKLPEVVPKIAEPLTACTACNSCLITMQTVVTATNSSHDPFFVAEHVYQACINHSSNGVLCTQLKQAVSYSMYGNLGKRAGAICSKMGACDSSVLKAENCTLKPSGSAVTLDLCTVEGWEGGHSVEVGSGAEQGKCTSDEDCEGGSKKCQLSSETVCTCAHGLDTCHFVGACVDYCDTEAVKAMMNKANAEITTCDDFNPCPGSLTCQASSTAGQLTCDSSKETPLQVSKTGFVCLPKAPVLQGARFHATGLQIVVGLNTAAKDSAFICSRIFSNATTTILGADAWCTASDDGLLIQLGPSATIKPEDALQLAENQELLVDKLRASPFSGSVSVVSCSPSCQAPSIMLTGPRLLVSPCDDSTSGPPVAFDASYSKDPSGRRFANVEWGQQGVVNPLLSSITENSKDKLVLRIPQATIAQLAEADYILTVKATSFLGTSGTATFTFTKRPTGEAPIISVVGGTNQHFKLADGLKLTSTLDAKSVCAGKEVEYSWGSLDAPVLSALPAGYNKKNLILPAPLPGVTADTAYKLRLTASFKGIDTKSSVDVTVIGDSSPVTAVVRGPSGDVKETQSFVLDATASIDPDDPQGTKPFKFDWECISDAYPTPCFKGANQGKMAGGKWEVPASLLTIDLNHRFQVTVSKSGRTSKASVNIRPRSAAIPSGKLTRVCAGACPIKHNTDAPLAVALSFNQEGTSTTWSTSTDSPQSNNADTTRLVLPAAALPSGGLITITAKLAKGGMLGEASVTVPLNARPVINDIGLFSIDDQFPDSTSELSATAYDDDKLSYTYGTMVGSQLKVASMTQASSYTFSNLPEGNNSVYVCAADAPGAQACQQTVVVVQPPPADFSAAEALFAMDVKQLKNANDPEVLAGGAAKLATLKHMAGSFTPQGGAKRRLLASSAESIESIVALKSSQLLDLLASSSQDMLSDPEGMRQVVSAASSLTMPNLGSSLRRALANMVQNAIDAVSLSSTRTVDCSYASDLIGIVAAINPGVKGGICLQPNGCDTPPAARRALLEAVMFNTTVTPSTAANAELVLQQLNSISLPLLASAQLNGGFLAAGKDGLYVSLGKQLGIDYANGFTLAVGPAMKAVGNNQVAIITVENAVVTFNSALQGPSVDNASLSTSDASVAIIAQLFQQPNALITVMPAIPTNEVVAQYNASQDTSATPPLLDLELMTPAVRLSLGDGASSDQFSCEGDCQISVGLPLQSTVSTQKRLVCLKVSETSSPYSGALVVASSWVATSTATAAKCNITQPGTYVVGQITNLLRLNNSSTNTTNYTSPSPSPSPSPQLGMNELDSAGGATATSLLEGKLLNSAAVQSCVGMYVDLVSNNNDQRLKTDSTGKFDVNDPHAGTFTFKSSYDGSQCKDSLTNVTVNFPMTISLPETSSAAITAISLLTVPALVDKGAAYFKGSPSNLWNYVYGMLGYQANDQANYFNFTGPALSTSNFTLAAVLGSNTQVMSTFVTAHAMLVGLNASSDAAAAAIVTATYGAFKSHSSSALTSNTTLIGMYRNAYIDIEPAAVVAEADSLDSTEPTAQRRHLLDLTITIPETIFAAVAQVVAGSNSLLQGYVDEARTAASSGESATTIASMLAKITKMAAVQQQSLAQSVTTISSDYIASGSVDPALLAILKSDFSGDSLQNKLDAVKIDESSLMAVLNKAIGSTEAPAARNMSWIAGSVVGGVVLVGAVLGYVILRRRRAQGIAVAGAAGVRADAQLLARDE